jgi:hypothetical protein
VFILVPDRADASGDEDLTLNNRSWRAILELLRPAGLVDEETLSRATSQFGGAHVTASEAAAIADYVERAPQGGDADARELLVMFADFARTSEGFRVM